MSARYKVGNRVIILIVLLGVVLPLFGVSVILITCYERFLRNKKNKKEMLESPSVESVTT